jgi:metal-sulfur cluster biosynthetic enzyme
MSQDSAAIIEALRSIYDPCCREKGISVVDMGLVRSATLEGGEARVELVLTSGWCPFSIDLVGAVRDRVESLPDVAEARVEVVWDEVWSSERLAPSARAKLRFLPEPGELGAHGAGIGARGRRAPLEKGGPGP